MGFAIYPKYSEFYSGEYPDLKGLLQDIPSIHTISFACYINALKHRDFQNEKIDYGLFQKLIKNQTVQQVQWLSFRMLNFIKHLEKQGARTVIFPTGSIMRLIQFEIENWKSGNFVQLSPKNEENIFKTILVLNQIEEESFLSEVKIKPRNNSFETFITYMWPNLLPTIEFQTPKEIILPLTYASEFFKYLETHPKLSPYLKTYLSKSNSGTWQEYLKNLTLFYLGGLNKGDNWFFFRIDAKYLESVVFVQEYILDLSKFDLGKYFDDEMNINFKQMRETPILKLSEGYYVMTNWNFFLEKLYNSQKFDFYTCSGVQEIYPGDKDKKWKGYNGDLGNFSEKKIFLKFMNKYLLHTASAIVEEDLKRKWNQDLYYRFQNEICFIEYKAVFFPVSSKFDEIKRSIDHPEKLLKSVKQLAKQIISFSTDINKFEALTEGGLESEKLIVYPLVVYSDINWSLYGIREYYNETLKDELAQHNLHFFKIEDLVLIHIDTFLEYEKLFLEDKIALTQVLNAHNKTRALIAEEYKKSSDLNSIMRMYADATVFLAQAYPGRYTRPSDSTYYKELMTELGIK